MSKQRRGLNNTDVKINTDVKTNTNIQSNTIVYWLINILLIALVSTGIYFAIDMMSNLTVALIISLVLLAVGIAIHIILSKVFKVSEKRTIFINLLIFIVVMLLGAFGGYTFVTNKYLNNDKIYQGVFVEECDLSMLTLDEARQVVQDYDKNMLAGISQSVAVDGNQMIYTAEELGIYSNAETVLSEAYNYGRTNSNFTRLKEIFALKTTPKVFSIDYMQNDDYINFIADNLVKKYAKDPQDASFSFDPTIDNAFIFIPEQTGMVLNRDDIVNQLKSNVTSLTFTDLSFNTDAVEPSVYLSDIQSNTMLIATCTTELEDDPDRTSNVDLASTTIEGIVQPGEVFSFNTATGERTVSAGYKVAHAIADGSELIDSVAGGVCQVASTLYSGLLDTNMEIVERNHHSFTVAYLPPGRDATVDFTTEKDFKFRNNTDAPVYIQSFVTDNEPDEYGVTLNTLTINVYGTIPDPGKSVVARVEVISSTAGGWETSFSDSVKTGSTLIVKNKINGKQTETYRDYYENGVLVESVLVSEDTYKSVTGKKIYGSG